MPVRSRTAAVIAALALITCATFAFGAVVRHYSGESAHGNASYGVMRTSLKDVYGQGNCAHCHEMHNSITVSGSPPSNPSGNDWALFDSGIDQTNNFCFRCHGDSSEQFPSLVNYNYSKTFGGYVGSTVSSIQAAFAFNPATGGSTHYLDDIKTYINTQSWGFTNDSNPCLACHDVHRAQRNHPVIANWDPPQSAIIKPKFHKPTEPNYRNLWGDERGMGELMSNYAGQVSPTGDYQPPYKYGTMVNEPAGKDIPNYPGMCMTCHQYNITRSSNASSLRLGNGSSEGNLTRVIAWETELHGNDSKSGDNFLLPYQAAVSNYILSCLDCHEPHGSRLPFLLREQVNYRIVNILDYRVAHPTTWDVSMQNNWFEFCAACHKYRVNDVNHRRLYLDGDPNIDATRYRNSSDTGVGPTASNLFTGAPEGWPTMLPTNYVWRNCYISPLTGTPGACHAHGETQF